MEYRSVRNQILISLIIIASLIWLGFIFAGGPTPVIRPTSNSAPHGSPPDNFSIPGTSHIPHGQEAVTVSVPEVRRKRGERKPVPELSQDDQTKYAHLEPSSRQANQEDRRGLDPAMVTAIPVLQAAGRRFAYGFLLSDEYLIDETREELQALGAEIRGIHGELYKARFSLEVDTLNEVLQLPYVQWVGFNTPDQKVDPRLQQQLQFQKSNDSEARVPVIINLFDGDPDRKFAAELEATGAVLGRYDVDLVAYSAMASPQAIKQMMDFDFVLFIEISRGDGPSHDQSMPSIGVDYIRPGATGAFDGSGVTLGIMDSGFMMTADAAVFHNDFGSKWGCGKDFSVDQTGTWNDQNGHGTHVLGTITGIGNGDSRYRGVATDVGTSNATPIFAAKIWNADGKAPDGTAMLDAMEFFGIGPACNGNTSLPKVVNISGGSEDVALNGTDGRSRKLDTMVWDHQQLYVVAAGNEGPTARTINAPGVAKNAMTVGNVLDHGYLTVGDIYDGTDGSSRGPTGDGRMKPNVVAPGRSVHSAKAGTTSDYIELFGTSMATPHVTGLALTLLEHYPDSFVDRPYLLRSHLMATAIPHESDPIPTNNNNGGRDTYGMGRVSTYISHWALPDADGWKTNWWWGTVTNTNHLQFDVDVPDGSQRLVIVMTWDEPAASAGASKAVNYDLDLWADHGADCTSSTGACGEYASQSNVDNVEYLVVDTPPSGTYRIKASPFNAPSSGLPTGISVVVIRGDLTPDLELTAFPNSQNANLGFTFSVTTTVSSPSYVASGSHLRAFPKTISTNVGTFGIGTAIFGPEPVGNFPLGDIVPTGGLGCSTAVIPSAPVSAKPQIALIERGVCFFSEKAFNAQQQGYDAYIVFNDEARADEVTGMSASTNDPVTIPGIFVGHSAGLALQTAGTQLSNISEVTLSNVSTVLKDGISTSFSGDNLTLGNIIKSDSRSATWTFQATSAGVKTVAFRVWSENGGTVNQTATITMVPDTGDDDDGDGVVDSVDNCPADANANQLDTDGDNQGDVCDIDDDNDGVPDTSDTFPINVNESADTDSDGTGNNADTDDDGDGMSDTFEVANGFDPLDASDAGLDADGDGLTNLDEFIAGSDPNDAASPVVDANVILASAVLPSSRSVTVGSVATAFATIINIGSADATNCWLTPITSVAADFFFQTTDPATNTLTGTRNTAVDIAVGAAQSFVFGFTPTAAFDSTEVQIQYRCANANAAGMVTGLNSLLLSASDTPIPDIVALGATVNDDGIVHIPGTTGTGFFAVASVNVGSSDDLIVSVDTGTVIDSVTGLPVANTFPIVTSLCQTDPSDGACINPITPTTGEVVLTINANETPTLSVFVEGTEDIALDAALKRIFLRFKDVGGVTRGSTSVAVQTDQP